MPNKSNSPNPEEKKPPAKQKKVMAGKEEKKKEETALGTASTSQTTTPNQTFLEGFWEGYGNDLVKSLNDYAQRKGLEDRIRREKERPVVYAIVLNDGIFPFKEGDMQWKLCKVGFTHRSIKKDTGNRMEQAINKILSKYKEKNPKGAKQVTASVLFALPFGAVDTTTFHDTEVRIRELVGKPVLKEKAKKIGLSIATEWVLTTQQHIDDIKREIAKKKGKESSDKAKMEAAKGESCEGDLNLDVFKESKLRFTAVPPDEHKDWLAQTKKKQ